ncbi:LutB/LldF family L-lactate oxidation iron-sulfur protein [Iodidimonas sp. SYSU 1G8]|uniref:LutB/LldF family L-lactate oxidation iron-sulfur protein n=1 Tax=Iodidimonas sp. SYSU 1G8 TaxID=3133967 RepID=UPI0031FED20C
MEIDSGAFVEKARVALADPTLQHALKHIKHGFVEARARAAENLPGFESMRDHARDIKARTIANLADYLEQFEANVTSVGGHVHWARDAEEARRIVGDICRQAGARTVTKSKSMVTEEIELNAYLEAQGIVPVETDLGEYIIQLRKEKPSHIIAPVIHLSKAQVADTFHEHHAQYGFHERLTERGDMVREARSILRERFVAADVGITGANFLIAETGSAVVVTNEGNADLTASLPDTHIVVTGIEKLVPTLDDCHTLLRLLTRSATGQDITTYMSFFTGPRRGGDLSGPSAFHVVLVDNGRSDMIGTEFEEMLRCIRCGACLNHCPVYANIGGHAYGSVYPGPMGAVLTPSLSGIEKAGHLPNASTVCGRCEEVCPVRIPLPRMMRHWREREFERHLSPRGMRWGMGFWAVLTDHPRTYRIGLWIASRALRLIAWRGWISRLPLAGGGWTAFRDMRAPSGGTFQRQWRKRGGRR